MKLVFDCETSGLFDYKKRADEDGQPRMCSLAAVLCSDDAQLDIIEEFYSLVKPDGWTVPAETAAIHGLTTEVLEAEGKPITEVLDGFMALYEKSTKLFAYGVDFDLKMLRGELRRAGREDRYGEKPKTCVMRVCTPLCKMPPTEAMMASGRKWNKTPKLSEAHEILLGEPMEGAHNALTDVMATIRIMRHLNQQKD